MRINHVTYVFQQLFLSSLWETSSFFNHLESGQVGEASGLSGHLSKVVSDYQEIVNMQKAAVEQVRYYVTVNYKLHFFRKVCDYKYAPVIGFCAEK